VAAIVILASGFARADAIATLVVVVLMLRAGSGLIRTSGRIFLEAAPAGLDPAVLGAAMAARPHVAEVHDLHIWEITTEMPAASAHVLVEPYQDCHAVRADLEDLLSRQYGITHLTLQVDHAPDTHTRPAPAGPMQAHDPTQWHEPAEAQELAELHETHEPPQSQDHDGHPFHCEDSHGPAYRPASDH
jgi:cobalt-zinc-cadmium efflux system protein